MIDFDELVARKGYGPRMSQTPQYEHWSGQAAVPMSDDLRRIIALPRRQLELDGSERAETIIDIETDKYTRNNIRCKCATIDPDRHAADGCITRLRLAQAATLREIAICGGAFGAIGVGHGKTLLDLLAPWAFGAYNLHNFVLAVPPGLVAQLIGDYEYIGQHFKMPQLVVHGTDYENTLYKMNHLVQLERDAPSVHVVPYSRLSRPEATDWLETRLKPDALIADECHKLRNIKTATGNRVYRYMEDHEDTRFAGWSGSVTSKTPEDYDHLAKWALRGGSPLPHDKDNTKDWARAVGAKGDQEYAGALVHLCEEGEPVREAFRRRLVETIGFVSTSAPAVSCELVLDEYEAPEIPENVQSALDLCRYEMRRPDGEELVTALDKDRVAMQLACGFYYKWIYPRCVFPRDTQLVLEWLDARGNWLREVRGKLKYMGEHMDSPRLVQNAAERAWGDRPSLKGLPVWKADHWCRWRDVRDKVYADTETVRLNDFLAKEVARIALESPQVVWYDQHAFGEWVAEISGLPLFGGGKEAKVLLLGDPKRGIKGEDGSRSVICSLKALGTGTNGLQRLFDVAGFPNPMSSPDGWEQGLGRLHRVGQKSPKVHNWFFRHTDELAKHVDSALNAALYVEGSLGAPQKINQAYNRTK